MPPLATVALVASWVCSHPPERGTSLHTACIWTPYLATLTACSCSIATWADDASATQANTTANNTVVSLHECELTVPEDLIRGQTVCKGTWDVPPGLGPGAALSCACLEHRLCCWLGLCHWTWLQLCHSPVQQPQYSVAHNVKRPEH